MLFVTFELGEDRYAIDSACVVEILPLVRIKEIPGAPRGIAGAIDLHGSPVPVVDLAGLALGKPARHRLSTRTILVRIQDAKGRPRLLGLLAERATGTVRRSAAEFVSPGIAAGGAPYLGTVATGHGTILQRVEVEHLLGDAARAALFPEEDVP